MSGRRTRLERLERAARRAAPPLSGRDPRPDITRDPHFVAEVLLVLAECGALHHALGPDGMPPPEPRDPLRGFASAEEYEAFEAEVFRIVAEAGIPKGVSRPTVGDP